MKLSGKDRQKIYIAYTVSTDQPNKISNDNQKTRWTVWGVTDSSTGKDPVMPSTSLKCKGVRVDGGEVVLEQRVVVTVVAIDVQLMFSTHGFDTALHYYHSFSSDKQKRMWIKQELLFRYLNV